jgi:hypothetical protein
MTRVGRKEAVRCGRSALEPTCGVSYDRNRYHKTSNENIAEADLPRCERDRTNYNSLIQAIVAVATALDSTLEFDQRSGSI